LSLFYLGFSPCLVYHMLRFCSGVLWSSYIATRSIVIFCSVSVFTVSCFTHAEFVFVRVVIACGFRNNFLCSMAICAFDLRCCDALWICWPRIAPDRSTYWVSHHCVLWFVSAYISGNSCFDLGLHRLFQHLNFCAFWLLELVPSQLVGVGAVLQIFSQSLLLALSLKLHMFFVCLLFHYFCICD